MNISPTERRHATLRWFSRTHLVLWFLVLVIPVTAATFTQRQKITSEPRAVGAQFGNAVAIDGDTMVVGARFDGTTASQAGAAFVFVLNGGTWIQQAKLLANDGAVADKFGYSVAISGNTIVVGAFNDDSPLSNAGSAYVFVRSGTTWTQQQKLTASDAAADQEFGNAVAINGDTVFVGEHFADLPGNSDAGAVYIYTRSGIAWTQVQKLIPAGGVIFADHFGESLAFSNNRLAVGSPGADIPFTAAGSVYVFAASGGAYIQQQKLSISDGHNGDSFGSSVAIEGNTLVGGATENTAVVSQPAFGAAYVFEFNSGTWTQQQKLTAADGASGDRFGYSVAVSNNVVAVGAREDDTAAGGDAGSAYVFTRSGTTWTHKQKLEPGDPVNGDRFGVSVALSQGRLFVGAAEKQLTQPNGQGAVYVFNTPAVFPDFDGDGKADLSFFNESNGQWQYTRSSDSSIVAISFGSAGDLMAPADYDGDRKTDIAVFRPSTGTWFRAPSSGGVLTDAFGTAGDLPVPADYDGDGKADLAFFRPSTGQFSRLNTSNGQTVTVSLGAAGDIPLIGDFDGDGRSDPAYFSPANERFGVLLSSTNTVSQTPLGFVFDVPVPADYDGDGKTDIGVFRHSSGQWFIIRSTDGTLSAPLLGASGDKPVAADFDGDGLADLAVFHPQDGNWLIQRTTQGLTSTPFGSSASQPVPLYFVRQVPTFQFSATDYSVNEDPTAAVITVVRTGDTGTSASVFYSTHDGSATQATDYTAAIGTLTFAAGERTKTFSIPITEDSFVEGNEQLTLLLTNQSVGTLLGLNSIATLTIIDDGTEPSTNPIDDAQTFVIQHYHDFLNREPDQSGLNFWTNEITGCGSNAQCLEIKRVNVSAAFFLSIEFQQTGYFVYRFYNSALNRPNGLPQYLEFMRDTQGVGRGVVVGADGWEAQLEANKVAYADEFVSRAEFISLYPSALTPTQFVDALYAHAALVPTTSERQAAIDEFNNPSGARGRVLRRIVESETLAQREFNRAFVLMQYFGYLRRNPDDAPDGDLSGYNFWLGKLNQFHGNFVEAEMVKAFINSGEYRHRFAP
ncbi:MAG TPA: Calx-beta domain-containing protein [Pyrinomonadaceae bacterium]